MKPESVAKPIASNQFNRYSSDIIQRSQGGKPRPPVPLKPQGEPKQYSQFEQWYMDNYGAEFGGDFSVTKPDDMDYNTWQTGQTLYDLYNTEKQAGEAYGQRIGDIDKQADFQNQQAYILAQKLQKYLGLTASAQGQKGIAAGDLIAANADYQNRLGSIASEMQGYRQDAEAGKQTALSTAKSQAQQSLAEIYGRQAQSAAQEETQVGMQTAAEQEQWHYNIDNVINQKLGAIQVDKKTGEYSAEDWQSVWDLYEQNKGKLSESQQQMMEFYLNNLDHEEAVEEAEEETVVVADESISKEQLSEFKKGKKTFVINGVEYVTRNGNATTSSLIAGKKKFDNGDYYKAGNGKEYVYYNGWLYWIKRA